MMFHAGNDFTKDNNKNNYRSEKVSSIPNEKSGYSFRILSL